MNHQQFDPGAFLQFARPTAYTFAVEHAFGVATLERDDHDRPLQRIAP
jgi:hypothetical protein